MTNTEFFRKSTNRWIMPEKRLTPEEQYKYRTLKEWYVDTFVDEYEKMNSADYWIDPIYRQGVKRPGKIIQALPESYPVGDLSTLFG